MHNSGEKDSRELLMIEELVYVFSQKVISINSTNQTIKQQIAKSNHLMEHGEHSNKQIHGRMGRQGNERINKKYGTPVKKTTLNITLDVISYTS